MGKPAVRSKIIQTAESLLHNAQNYFNSLNKINYETI